MWADAIGLLEQAERRHRQFFGLAEHASAQPRWEPPADVVESPTEVCVTVALPGIEPAQIEIELEPRGLAIRAERQSPSFSRGTVIRRLEIPYGHFVRRINLPPGSYELTDHSAQHGCLSIRLRKL